MLSPAQVLPFLQHDDASVRDLALAYFSTAHDPSPATADDVWRMLDTKGPGKDQTAPYSALQSLPQNEISLRRTVEALNTTKNGTERDSLQSVILALPFGILNRFRDVTDDAPLDEAARQQVTLRFKLAEIPASELWERLASNAAALDESADCDGDELDTASAMVEALTRSPESAQWALAELGDKSSVSFLKAFAIQLLGTMRHRPSAPLIADYLTLDPHADLVIEAAEAALMKIGGNAVVQILRERYSGLSDGLQFYFARILSAIKTPQSELALNQLISIQTKIDQRTALAESACNLAATVPGLLSQLYQMIKTDKWDRTMADLDESVVALFTMVNNNVPELPQWRAALDDTKARTSARRSAHREWFERSQRKQKTIKSIFDASQEDPDVIWDTLDSKPQDTGAAIPAPIRRSAAKVGRNDPCPCGSGKKYKKCCGK